MIRQLPRQVVERIAAGEVIERPASVVKELLENALDAGATRIELLTEQGGKRLIRVADNGSGMPLEDLRLAFAPHATSKLTRVDDLTRIASFGFRGEALSSIGAVARARIVSRPAGQAEAYELRCEGGQLDDPRPVGAPVGTTLEVSNLFFNIPARARFLKGDAAETSRCVDHLVRMALFNPGVAFTMRSSERKLFEVSEGASCRERIATAYGERLGSGLIEMRRSDDTMHIEAWLGPPDLARASVRHQQMVLNGRLVRDATLRAAVQQAYREFLAPALQPLFFLSLTIDPAEVDVNVHPAKSEVRFRDSKRVFRAVRQTVLEGLRRADLSPRPGAGPPPAGVPVRPFTRPVPGRRPAWSGTVAEPQPEAPWTEASQQAELPTEPRPPVPAVPALTGRGYLGVFDTYLLYQSGEELVLVDQHALHERVVYERLRREYLGGAMVRQRLLVPEVIEVGRAQVLRIEEQQAALERLGLELTPMGEGSVAVHAIPALLKDGNVAELVWTALNAVGEHEAAPLEERLHTLACHAAVRAGDRLEAGQIEALLEEAAGLPEAKACPHGRPTSIRLARTDLERWFKRSGF